MPRRRAGSSTSETGAHGIYDPLLKRGYTVFAVAHGSQPKFHILEMMQDMHRAVRFIRFNAGRFGIDPKRCAVTFGGISKISLRAIGLS